MISSCPPWLDQTGTFTALTPWVSETLLTTTSKPLAVTFSTLMFPVTTLGLLAVASALGVSCPTLLSAT